MLVVDVVVRIDISCLLLLGSFSTLSSQSLSLLDKTKKDDTATPVAAAAAAAATDDEEPHRLVQQWLNIDLIFIFVHSFIRQMTTRTMLHPLFGSFMGTDHRSCLFGTPGVGVVAK
mmetsp:Transcript_52395/g.126803  ORF Transcript_52395/g.126803 Transcript_52395/m.126803 type:complete len:116 (-) Transcript_52395:154-501(-)